MFLTSWSRIVAEDRGGGTLCFPPLYLPIEFPKYWSHDDRTYFFWKELCISDFLTTYLMVIGPKTTILEILKKSFSSKTAKIATFCNFRFYIGFPIFSKKIKISFFQGTSNLRIFLSFYQKSITGSALRPP